MVEEASHYNHGMQCAKNAHTAASSTNPASQNTLLLTGQSRTIVGRENVVHRTQTTRTYNAPKPEQKTVQVKDSWSKLRLPEREGNSMTITCYKRATFGPTAPAS